MMEKCIDVFQEENTRSKTSLNGLNQTEQEDQLRLMNEKITDENILHIHACTAKSLQSAHVSIFKDERNKLGSRGIACSDQPLWKFLWHQRPAWLRGFYFCNAGDRTFGESLTNILTSVPFIFVGLQTPRKKFVTRLYADSLVGIGLASSLYHSSRGEIRNIMRWGDYAMIAAANLCLSRVLHKGKSDMLCLATAAVLPFNPVAVATIHIGMNEVTLARKAIAEPHLRKAYGLHAISTLAGAALFLADDVHPNTPYIHAAWHLVAALGVLTINQLFE